MRLLRLFIVAAVLITGCSDLTGPGLESGNQNDGDQSVNNNGTQQTASSSISDSDVWVGAYLASWNHYVEPTGNWGNLPTSEIDWDAFTHLFYFALSANQDGSLSTIEAYRNMSPDRINAIVTAAHDHGKPVLFTVGGWGNYEGFSSAISTANREVFISNIVATIQKWGFDGVDIDMEPIKDADKDNYKAFIRELHTALSTVDVAMADQPLLTVATNWHADMFAQIEDKIDQINLMTYDLAGAWQGWETWHNSAVSSDGRTFPNIPDRLLPSIDEKVKSFTAAGIDPGKLGIGIDFYGYVWSGGTGTSTGGATKPNQTWDTAPTVTDNVPYHKIMNEYYSDDLRRWDEGAQAVYLSIDKSGSADDKFISYDDEQSIYAKFDYAREHNLGGTIIWELSGGYREDQPAGERDVLLQAVKDALNGGGGGGGSSDTEAPSVSVNRPLDGATVSGTVTIEVQSSDNVGVSNVDLVIDGEHKASFGGGTQTYDWDTDTHPNQQCTIEVHASDAAGNRSSSSVAVTVDNSEDTSPGTFIYQEELENPWVNASWSANVDFQNSGQAADGTRSIRVAQDSWGALSVHSGNWGNGQDRDPANYEAVEFAIYPESGQAEISVMLENDAKQDFPRVSFGTLPSGEWSTVRVAMSDLNPDGLTFHRVDVLETSGTSKTYYVDNFILAGSGDGSGGGGDDGDGGGGDDGDGSGSDTYHHIYIDQLESPWANASWNASVDFTNTELTANAIKVRQDSWGALSLLNGNWGNTEDINTSQYKALEFRIYTPDSGVSMNVWLQSSSGNNPPKHKYGSVPANKWTSVSIPMSELNPESLPVERLNFTETSGTTKTYFIDDVRFVDK